MSWLYLFTSLMTLMSLHPLQKKDVVFPHHFLSFTSNISAHLIPHVPDTPSLDDTLQLAIKPPPPSSLINLIQGIYLHLHSLPPSSISRATPNTKMTTTTTTTTTHPTNPSIKTHHCACCSTLLLATTYTLPALPRRRSPACDKALILPLPAPSNTSLTTNTTTNASTAACTVLLSTTQDRTPLIVQRSDGFEKRVLLRCGRCRVVVGYLLADVDQVVEEKVVYLLPGAVVESEELVKIVEGAGRVDRREEEEVDEWDVEV